MISLLVAAIVSFGITVLLTPVAVRLLRARRVGQPIQEEVAVHQHKAGSNQPLHLGPRGNPRPLGEVPVGSLAGAGRDNQLDLLHDLRKSDGPVTRITRAGRRTRSTWASRA